MSVFGANNLYTLNVELSFALVEICNWIRKGGELKDVEEAKFGLLEGLDTSRQAYNKTFRVDVLPGEDPAIDSFFHSELGLHTNVFDANIYVSAPTLSEELSKYCAHNGIRSLSWKLNHNSQVLMFINDKLVLATPIIKDKILELRKNRMFKDYKRPGDDSQITVDLGVDKDGRSQSTKCWEGISRHDFAYHNGLAHFRVLCATDEIQYDTSIPLM